MVITNLEEKQNRKIWVPIRGGNRGGWSLFQWEKVREMPYRDREMYLGNSAKIGVLDKGGKWRKKDWYLHKDKLESGQQLTSHMSQAMRRDQQRMKAALGLTEEDDHEQKLTPAEMAILLKRIRGSKEQEEGKDTVGAMGLGFDKAKVEIRAKPSAKEINPHRLQGNIDDFDERFKKEEKKHKRKDRSRSKSEKKKKKHKKEKHEQRERSESEDRHRKKDRHRSRSRSSERKDRKKKEKKNKHREDRH